MSLTLNLSVKDIDSDVLEWYTNSDPELVSEALWYGWKSATYNQTNNLQTNKKIDELKSRITELEKDKSKIQNEYHRINNTIYNLADSIVSQKTNYMKITVDELNNKIKDLEEINSQKNEELIEIREIFNNSKKKGDYAEEKINEYLEKELKSDFIIYEPGLENQKHQGDTHILIREENEDKNKPYLDSILPFTGHK